MSQITGASLPLVLAERFDDFEFSPEFDTRALVRHFLAYLIELEGRGRLADVARVLATVEDIVTSAEYGVQDIMIVELVDTIERADIVARFGPASKKWWNYHVRQRSAEPGDSDEAGVKIL